MPGAKQPVVLPLAVALVFLAACGGSSQRQAEKLLQQVGSWEATARLTRELAQERALPEQYTRQVLEAVEEGLDQARKQSAKSQ